MQFADLDCWSLGHFMLCPEIKRLTLPLVFMPRFEVFICLYFTIFTSVLGLGLSYREYPIRKLTHVLSWPLEFQNNFHFKKAGLKFQLKGWDLSSVYGPGIWIIWFRIFSFIFPWMQRALRFYLLEMLHFSLIYDKSLQFWSLLAKRIS